MKLPLKSLAILLGSLPLVSCAKTIEADYHITGGMVYIGDQSGAIDADVAIRGDQIILVDTAIKNISAGEVIDASGMIVAPGFIDPHTHSYENLVSEDDAKRRNDNYRFQGVTTVFNGNDGFGTPDIAEQIASLEADGIGTNTALFIGHGATRKQVMGLADRPPNPNELSAMKALVDTAMKNGALGLSTGLFYAPGSFSNTYEVIQLAKSAAAHGGVYDSHIRDESTYNIGLEAAIDEVIEIGEKANIPVHIAHIKALGVDVWGKSKPIIENVNAARARGVRVTADQYPWPASGTRISNALLPRWVKAGSEKEYMARLEDEGQLPKIKIETAENIRRRGGPKAVLITQDKFDWVGKTLDIIAAENNLTPVDMAIEIAKLGDAKIASFNMNEDDIKAFMVQDWVMTSSDGSSGHPRKYASFPRKYETYVKGQSIMPVEAFIYRSSGLVAETFGLCDRGFLKAGYKADIAIIDPDSFTAEADFQSPEKLSKGVMYLFVNGQAVVKEGKSLASLPGRVLKPCQADK